MIRVSILILLLTLNGCALWDFFKPGGGLAVDTELVVGDKDETIATEVVGNKDTTNNDAGAIVQTYNTVNEQYPWWVLALLILGWMLPGPARIGRWLSSLFHLRRS